MAFGSGGGGGGAASMVVAMVAAAQRQGQLPEAVGNQQHAGKAAPAGVAQPAHQGLSAQADPRHRRQGAQAKGQHQQGRVQRVGTGQGPPQGGIDQATGQQAPAQAQRQGISPPLHRQQSPGPGLDVAPQQAADRLQAGQPHPPLAQIQAHGDEQQPGDGVQHHRRRRQLLSRAGAQGSHQRSQQGIAGDAPAIEQQDQAGPSAAAGAQRSADEIGRASCRGRVETSGGGGSYEKK